MIADVEVAPGAKGLGVYARRDLRAGEFIFRRRHTKVVGAAEVATLPEWEQEHLCELDFDRYAVLASPGCYLNHSCEPNAMRHGVVVFAWSNIHEGDEITIDYRLNAFGDETWRCDCGASSCTGTVVGSFSAMSCERQDLLLPHAPAFIQPQYNRRTGVHDRRERVGSARQNGRTRRPARTGRVEEDAVSNAGDVKRAAITGFVAGFLVAFVVLVVVVAVPRSLSAPAVLAIVLVSLVVGGGLGGFAAAGRAGGGNSD